MSSLWMKRCSRSLCLFDYAADNRAVTPTGIGQFNGESWFNGQ